MAIFGVVRRVSKLEALGNERRDRRASAALAAKQREQAKLSCLAQLNVEQRRTVRQAAQEKRLQVVFTRFMSGRDKKHDDDGLARSFKHIRDGVADFLLVDDSPTAGVQWKCAQERPDEPDGSCWIITFLAPKPTIEISGLWVRSGFDGGGVEVLVEINGEWRVAQRHERLLLLGGGVLSRDGLRRLSHITETLGLEKAKKDTL